MIDPIAHRGPDDHGIWSDQSVGVGLGFRRLSIIDLSAHGHQPMVSPSGRFVVVFNGEIYNHQELRRDLERSGFVFRGHSDTETMVAAFDRWGIEAAVRRFVGMFAIAAWDRESRQLSLIRDRLGKKPLYVFQRPGHVLFGSELKALVAGPDFDRTISSAAVTAYLRYLYVPAPLSIFEHTLKVLPGHILTLESANAPIRSSSAYWSVDDAAKAGSDDPFVGSDDEGVDELERLLSVAVRRRLHADVPVGALLSGGIDSSAVVALAQTMSDRPLRTYSIGFDVAEFDESRAAADVAEHLGTEHTAFRLSGNDALAVVPSLPDLFDEPLADPSQIPTYLVCRLARRDVTVALSGDGGDEILGGYHRYIEGERVITRLEQVPRRLRRWVGVGIQKVPSMYWDRGYRAVEPLLPANLRHRLPGEKLLKVGALMERPSSVEMYRSLLSAWQSPATIVIGGEEVETEIENGLRRGASRPILDNMMAVDQATYLADDLLAKVDRASMAVSLEVRVPLLDHELVEFTWRLPRRFKIRGNVGKWALRQVLYRHVPRTLVDRPKMGFTVPIHAWLNGPLKEWASDLLFTSDAASDRLIDPAALKRSWAGLERGDAAEAKRLWAVLMLEAWRRRWAIGS
jgi:asparagine synthase (glutamine-hydrolysing)